jgi:hypothetical protein
MMPATGPAVLGWQYGRVTDRDLLREAVAELYGVAPHEFIARRAALAAAARGAGDQPAARQIAALRKPTQSAWVVNQLARSVPSAATQLSELGTDLRRAQRTLDGTAIRELSVRRRELIDDLTRRAFTAVDQTTPPAALRDEVSTTLAAVVADPEVAGQFEAGAMARAARSDGFGTTGPLLTVVGPSDAPPAAARPAPAQTSRVKPASARTTPAKAPATPATPATSKGATARAATAPSVAAPKATEPKVAEPKVAEPKVAEPKAAEPKAAEPKVAEPKAAGPKATGPKARPGPVRPVSAATAEKERRDRHRRALADAQKAATKADRAARAATKTEQDLERTVLTLEEKLADAREQLNEARLKARRARTSSRQLHQSLDRLRA